MALDLSGLIADLEALIESGGATELDAATSWADAIRAFTSDIEPSVASGVQNAARAAMQSTLNGPTNADYDGMSAPQAPPVTSLPAMDAAFAVYASSLAAVMPTGVPPPAPVSSFLIPTFSTNSVPGTTPAQVALSLATAINAWFVTGTSGGNPWL
jgi:hypothetical protein